LGFFFLLYLYYGYIVFLGFDISYFSGQTIAIDFDNSVLLSVAPVKFYANADTNKAQILKENRSKSGIYQWVNLSNGKTYVGSSSNLTVRFMQYFNIKYLLRNNTMAICNAMFYHGYSKFSLTVLEYSDKTNLIKKEQFYLDFLQPEYNI